MPESAVLPIRFQCPICLKSYATVQEAETCRDVPTDWSGWRLGDLCIIPGTRRYYSTCISRPEWLAFTLPADPASSSHFDRTETFFPWWVVTALHRDRRDRHRALITVSTLAFGKLYDGWNPADGDGHHAMYRPGVPEAEQRSAASSTWWQHPGIAERIMAAVPPDAVLKDAVVLADSIESGSLLS